MSDPETVTRICLAIADQSADDLESIPKDELATIARAVRELKVAVDRAVERLAHVDITMVN